MKKWIGIIAIIIISIGLLTGAFFLYKSLSQNYVGQENKENSETDASSLDKTKTAIKDFTLYDGDGKAVSSSALVGKPTVMYFWASWCSFCKDGMPNIQSAYEKYGDEVQFVTVALTGGGSDTKAAADKVIADKGYTFPVYYDNDSSAAMAYSIRSIPALYFLDETGKIVTSSLGSPSKTYLESTIDSLVS